MHRRSFRPFLSALLMAGLAVPVAAQTVYGVDPAIRYQTWEGWGTSLCWWANIVGGYPDPVRKDIENRVFTYLGLNVVRYNIGGRDDPSHHHLSKRAAVPGFLRRDGTYDWTADANQLKVLREAKSLGANRFEAFSNSPPYWMTWSGCASGNTGGGNNFRDSYRLQFADYLTTVVKRIRDVDGIEFETVDPMNEPAANWWNYGGGQEGCHVDTGDLQSSLITAVGASLKAKGLKTQVSASDESLNTWAVSSWDALSPAAKGYVKRLNTHCYGGDAQHWVNHRAVRDGKRLWMSEYGDGDPSGLTTANQIVRDLRVMMPTAWVYWQALEQVGANWGFIECDLNAGKSSITTLKKYYAFANFSRFIRPGAKFISIGDESAVAALDSASNLVIVIVNSGAARSAIYDLSRFTSTAAVGTVYRTSPTENLTSAPSLPIKSKRLSVNLPSQSVTTVVIRSCAYSKVAFEGFYRLRSSRTSKALDVPGSTWDQGAWLTTWFANDGNNQQWRLEGTGDGFYKLCNRDSGKYMAIDNGNAYLPVLQWDDNGDWTAQWAMNDLGSGAWMLTSRKRLLYGETSALDENPTPGNGWPDVVSYPWYAGAEQKWWFDWRSGLYPSN